MEKESKPKNEIPSPQRLQDKTGTQTEIYKD